MAETDTTATQPEPPETFLDEPERPAAAPETPADPAPPPQKRSRGGFAGGLIGGVLAAGAGFGLAQIVPQGWPLAGTATLEAQLAAQSQELAALKAELGRLAGAPAPDAALADRVAALESAPAAAPDLSPLEARIGAVESRLSAIEAMPADGSAASPAALAALQAEIESLKTGGGVAAATEAVAKAAEERLQAAEARAAALQAETEAMVAKARARTALGQLVAAMDSGTPYAALLPDLGEVPEPLAAQAATGIPTLPSLRDSFPEAARRALEASLQADMGATWAERIGSFLQAQTGARSLTPREGADPDAVLSRAEAALAQGDLAAALTELEALPEAGKTAMQPWRAKAEARQAAIAALAGVTARIDG